MSIRSLVNHAIEGLRSKLSVIDNPVAAPAEKAEAVKAILLNDSAFWAEIAKRAAPATKKSVASPAEVAKAAKPVAPTTTVTTVPARPATVAARVLTTVSSQHNGHPPVVVRSGDFAAKLNGAAKELGLEDKSPLAQFRKVLGQDGRGKEYWDDCRAHLLAVLSEGLLKEQADWKLLVSKTKRNLFFGGKTAEMFLRECPKELAKDLLLGEGGLFVMVETIRAEEEPVLASPYRVAFIIDLCVRVGAEAKGLLVNCKHAVNRMKQLEFIPADHWLVAKVAAMKVVKPVVATTSADTTTTPLSEAKLDDLQQVAEAVVTTAVN